MLVWSYLVQNRREFSFFFLRTGILVWLIPAWKNNSLKSKGKDVDIWIISLVQHEVSPGGQTNDKITADKKSDHVPLDETNPVH